MEGALVGARIEAERPAKRALQLKNDVGSHLVKVVKIGEILGII